MVLATQCLLQRRPKTLRVAVDGALPRRRVREGPDPRHHRAPRRRRRHRPRHRVRGRGRPRALDGAADDAVQHVDRGRRARRPRRAGRHDVRVPRRPARSRRPAAAWDARGRALADAGDRRRRGVRPRAWRSTAGELGADDHVRHEPGHGHPDRRSRCPTRRRCRRPRTARRCAARSTTCRSRPGQPLLGHTDRRRLRRQLHERAAVGPARGGGRPARPARRAGRPDARRPRLAAGQAGGRGRGPGPRLRGGGRGVARARAARCASR